MIPNLVIPQVTVLLPHLLPSSYLSQSLLIVTLPIFVLSVTTIFRIRAPSWQWACFPCSILCHWYEELLTHSSINICQMSFFGCRHYILLTGNNALSQAWREEKVIIFTVRVTFCVSSTWFFQHHQGTSYVTEEKIERKSSGELTHFPLVLHIISWYSEDVITRSMEPQHPKLYIDICIHMYIIYKYYIIQIMQK